MRPSQVRSLARTTDGVVLASAGIVSVPKVRNDPRFKTKMRRFLARVLIYVAPLR